jgi:hypothetical protein
MYHPLKGDVPGSRSVVAVLPIGAIYVPTKFTVQSGAKRHHEVTRRPQAGALLTVILVGSRLERREDGCSHTGALGGRDGGRPVTGGARGCARAAARRAPQGAKAELPVRSGEYPAGACARPAERAVHHRPRQARYLVRDHAPDGARRAPRAFKDVKNVLALGRILDGDLCTATECPARGRGPGVCPRPRCATLLRR